MIEYGGSDVLFTARPTITRNPGLVVDLAQTGPVRSLPFGRGLRLPPKTAGGHGVKSQ